MEASAIHTWDVPSLMRHATMTFDAGDRDNASLYVFTLEESASAKSLMTVIDTLRLAKLWSSEPPKTVTDQQRPVYEAQLAFKELHAFPDLLAVVARFDHPRFPSSPTRFQQWKAALAPLAGPAPQEEG
jgi:hypothetical protein